MRLVMVGSGYVGLVSGVCFADFGHDVVCVDKDPAKIARLKAGEVPIFEPGLDVMLQANMKAGRLSFTTDLAEAAAEADAIFIAVGTPTRRGDGHADLSLCLRRRPRDRRGRARGAASSSPSRPCRSAPATRSSASSREARPGTASASSPTRNSCARARRSRISSGPTASSSAPTASRAQGHDRDLPAALHQPGAAALRQPAHLRADQIRRPTPFWR